MWKVLREKEAQTGETRWAVKLLLEEGKWRSVFGRNMRSALDCASGSVKQEVEKVGEEWLKVSTWGRRFVDSQEAWEDPRAPGESREGQGSRRREERANRREEGAETSG